jgi:flagellin
MARINTNVGAVIAQRHLDKAYSALSTTMERLSTGLRVNHGKDDPAGLIVSERLRSETGAVTQAISNAQRASLIISTTEGALDEVAALLRDIQQLTVQSANEGALSDDEIKANQLQVDSAIASIERIANSTTFAGRSLLNGSLDYITSGVVPGNIDSLAVHGALFGTRDYIPVEVQVIQSAQYATLVYDDGALSQDVTIEIQGNVGATTLSFAAGTSAPKIAEAINQISDATGVTAVALSNPADGFTLKSAQLGSKNFVSVQLLPGSGDFTLEDATGDETTRTVGRDATANINGAQSIGDGNNLTLKTSTLDIDVGLAQTFGTGTTSFAITEGGALFQIGAHINSNLQVNIGVQSVAPSRLGNGAIGYLSQLVTGEEFSLVSGNCEQASKIIDEAINQVSLIRGRLGAFEKNTLQTTMNQLGITQENLMSADSSIRDADFAYETSELTRNQVLVSSGTTALGLANQTPQMVLKLLGG